MENAVYLLLGLIILVYFSMLVTIIRLGDVDALLTEEIKQLKERIERLEQDK